MNLSDPIPNEIKSLKYKISGRIHLRLVLKGTKIPVSHKPRNKSVMVKERSEESSIDEDESSPFAFHSRSTPRTRQYLVNEERNSA